MSDITIPGVTSRFNTDKIVEDLMKVERVPLDRAEESVKTFEEQRTNWQGINRNLSNLEKSAKILYGHENPFQERTGISSDEQILTVTASREAAIEEREFTVLQTAEADRFLSSSLSKDFTVPQGEYQFTIGESDISFRFRGGSLDEFAEMINKKGRDLIGATVVNDTSDTRVILIESKKEGLDNTLIFGKDAASFGLTAGLLRENLSTNITIPVTAESIHPWEKALSEGGYALEEGSLILQPDGEVMLQFPQQIVTDENLVLEYTVQVEEIPRDAWQPPSPPPGPETPPPGAISVGNLTVKNAPSSAPLPQYQPPDPPERRDNLQVIYAGDGSNTIPLPEIEERGAKTYTLPLKDYVNAMDSLKIRNANSHRIVSISDIRIYDPSGRGEYAPNNAISEARNSKLLFQGIEIERDSNDIDDIMPGVSLHLKRSSSEPINISIEADTELVKEKLIEFVYHYNTLMTDILILTSREEEIVDEISYYTDEEREAALEKLGLFQGDMTLMQMKSRYQRIMMEPYRASEDSDFFLLSQIGISTNATDGGFDRGRLRGYIEINEDTLDNVLQNNLEDIKEMFGWDSDGDLVIDTGLAKEMELATTPYIQTGGIIAMKLRTIDTQVSSLNDKIETMEEKLEKKEAEYKQQYAEMEAAVDSMQQSTQQLNSLNNSE